MNPPCGMDHHLHNVSSEMPGLINSAHYHDYTMAMFERRERQDQGGVTLTTLALEYEG